MRECVFKLIKFVSDETISQIARELAATHDTNTFKARLAINHVLTLSYMEQIKAMPDLKIPASQIRVVQTTPADFELKKQCLMIWVQYQYMTDEILYSVLGLHVRLPLSLTDWLDKVVYLLGRGYTVIQIIQQVEMGVIK